MSLTVNCRDVQANTNQNTNYPKCIHGKIQGKRYQFLKVFKSNITQKMISAKYVEPMGYQILHYIMDWRKMDREALHILWKIL